MVTFAIPFQQDYTVYSYVLYIIIHYTGCIKNVDNFELSRKLEIIKISHRFM